MRLVAIALMLASLAPPASAHTRKTTPAKKSTPASRQAPAKKATAQPALTRAQAELSCPSELGLGVATKRRFCDVLAGREPAGGVLVTIPPHRGPVTLSFELHNRHTYSEELVKAKRAFRQYTATIGVFTMDNTLIDRAAIQTEFRTERDLYDRVGGGAGPGGVKAVAPAGSEFISIELPADVGEQVSLVGEKLTVIRPDGTDTFVSEGRPIATISNVMVEYRPGPPPRKVPTRKP
ncbi:MAG: hypothetical protein IT177_15780 [Acidobacteria bacterium]|nr:hypothetical protein [Acidobacteriota bacterium]